MRSFMKLKKQSCSGPVFATYLILRIFTKYQLNGCNVDGKGTAKKDKKIPLDQTKMKYVQDTTSKLYNSLNCKEFWNSCKKQMNRKILQICPENKFETRRL